MFKKPLRLQIQKFKSSSISSKTLRTPLFILRVAPNGLSVNRYGFIVSKKIDKRAVGRNQAKRILRSCIRGLAQQVKIGYDMLFIVQKSPLQKMEKDPCDFIKEVLQKENLVV